MAQLKQTSKPVEGFEPICVDLDQSLIRTDVMIEGFLSLFNRHPLYLLSALFALFKGRPEFKRIIAERSNMDVASLPYNEELLETLKAERAKGREIILATAAHRLIADRVAEHLGIFDDVLATEDEVNLSGRKKAKALVERYGEKGFIYVGDCRRDLAVWKHSAGAMIVNPGPVLKYEASRVAPIVQIFGGTHSEFKAAFKCMRPHQWVKNLLIFAPLVLSHRVADMKSITVAALAFLAFSITSSSVYVLNDLADLRSDRRHPVKRKRPFASGRLSLQFGIVLFPLLLILGIRLAASVSWQFASVVGCYYFVTLMYSLRLKQVIVADVLILAGLYTIRIFAGSVATKIPVSTWLLAFSIFFFLSLALVKRISELVLMHKANKTSTEGRGYLVADLWQLQGLGAAAGYLAVLIFALYITSPEIIILYGRPEAFWLICPLLLYWVSRMLLLAGRGMVHSDPIVFALRDKTSWVLGLLVLGIAVLAQAM